MADYSALRHFTREEFTRPELMEADFLSLLDEWRERCGFGIKILNAGRLFEDMVRIYGPDISTWSDSPHKRGLGVDCRPVEDSAASRLVMIGTAIDLWEEGRWSRLGLGIYDKHLHVDNDTKLRRPWLWVGKSK